MAQSKESKAFYMRFVDSTTSDKLKRKEWKEKFSELENRSVEFHAELLILPNGRRIIICTKIILGRENFSKRLFREIGAHRFINVKIQKGDWNKVRRFSFLGNFYERYSLPANPAQWQTPQKEENEKRFAMYASNIWLLTCSILFM